MPRGAGSQLRASPGQGTAPVNPSPFFCHKGKKSPPGRLLWDGAGREGREEGALIPFSPRCSNPSVSTSARLCPSATFTINHVPGGGGMPDALERWVLRMGHLPPALWQHRKGELVGTGPAQGCGGPRREVAVGEGSEPVSSPRSGDVHVGVADRNGQLEVEVIQARGLIPKMGSKSIPGR